MADSLQAMSGLFERVQERDIFEPIDEDESAKGYNYCSDSDLEDDEDGANVESKPTDYSKDVKNKGVPRRGGLMDVTKHLKTSRDPPTGCSSDFCKKGKVIKIHDTAFITYAFSNLCHVTTPLTTDADSRHSCSISTRAASNLRPMDRGIANQGGLRWLPHQKIRYLDRPQSQYTGSQTRYSLVYIVTMALD